MKRVISYLKIILGSFIIGLSLNLFFTGFNFLPSGIFGLGMLYSIKTKIGLPLSLLLLNLIFLGLTMAVFGIKYVKKEAITFWLIPLFIYLTSNIDNILNIYDTDRMLIAIYGGALIGVGSSLIYNENAYVSGSNVLNLIDKLVFKRELPITIAILDILMLIILYFEYGISTVLYSSIAMVIMEVISKRVMIGVHASKVFYIITNKEKEIKEYILNELKCDITEFDVKGGFTRENNKILMTVIPTEDYYKLKEGIRAIDPKAFISITESYEVINDNLKIKG